MSDHYCFNCNSTDGVRFVKELNEFYCDDCCVEIHAEDGEEFTQYIYLDGSFVPYGELVGYENCGEFILKEGICLACGEREDTEIKLEENKMTGLRAKLVDYLQTEAKPLSDIYEHFSEESKTTIRGRLNENIGKCFKRIGTGIYIAEKGDAKALIIEGDSWKEIKNLEDDSIDCIITDSPYTSLDKHYKIGSTRKRNLNKSVGFETKDLDLDLLTEMFRVMKIGAHFFSFLPCDAKDTLKNNNRFIEMAMEVGFEFNKRAFWDKQVIGMGYNMRNRHEQIIFLSKGKRRMPIDLSIPDVLSHKRIYAKHRIHVAQKPNELIADLIKFSTLEGEVILDLFAGSMVLAEVGLELNRNTISIESDKKMIKKSIKMRPNLRCNTKLEESKGL